MSLSLPGGCSTLITWPSFSAWWSSSVRRGRARDRRRRCARWCGRRSTRRCRRRSGWAGTRCRGRRRGGWGRTPVTASERRRRRHHRHPTNNTNRTHRIHPNWQLLHQRRLIKRPRPRTRHHKTQRRTTRRRKRKRRTRLTQTIHRTHHHKHRRHHRRRWRERTRTRRWRERRRRRGRRCRSRSGRRGRPVVVPLQSFSSRCSNRSVRSGCADGPDSPLCCPVLFSPYVSLPVHHLAPVFSVWVDVVDVVLGTRLDTIEYRCHCVVVLRISLCTCVVSTDSLVYGRNRENV